MNLEIIFEYLLNFTLALFIVLVMYLYYNDEISSLLAWINIIGGAFLRLVFIELITQNNEWIVSWTSKYKITYVLLKFL